ncbi:agmatinase [Trichoderma arundinaceum]|uniref:Agmatinase n=1 Tax=Trichoderma arundinaceum TaxID=490622 RepID=A0A395NGK1_TRIAR|nr:agmatinase [Trichoderma arundinaceum]
MAARLSVSEVSAQSILMSADLIFTTISLGIGVASSHMIGALLGADQPILAQQAVLAPYALSIALGAVELIFIMMLRSNFGYMFTSDREVVEETAKVLPLMAIFQVLDLSNGGAGGILRGARRNHLSAVSALAAPHTMSSQWPLISPQKHQKEEFDLEPTATYAFAGITTFSQLQAVECLTQDGPVDDILIVGFPFDTATSYRTGTRFGPNAIRQGSRAISLALLTQFFTLLSGHYNYRQSINPFQQNISVVDCGDLPVSPFDNALAFAQMEEWYSRLLNRPVKTPESGISSKITGRKHPQIVSLGGDHSISLPILRALHRVHGAISAIHIDAHIDTWSPKVFAGSNGSPSKQSQVADGTPYYWAGMEGLLTKSSVHAGIRSSLDSNADLSLDAEMGFTIIPAGAMLQENGLQHVIQKIRDIVPHKEPVYVSLDIDSLDPAFAPGTAGPAAGGWTSREVIQIIIESLQGLNVVGVDVVEVLPGMDSAEITGIVAAELTFEIITSLVKNRINA